MSRVTGQDIGTWTGAAIQAAFDSAPAKVQRAVEAMNEAMHAARAGAA